MLISAIVKGQQIMANFRNIEKTAQVQCFIIHILAWTPPPPLPHMKQAFADGAIVFQYE
jgi:hypothetical protein